MKAFIALALLLSITACAMQQPADKYVQMNLQLAESGALKWSDYYKGLFDEIARSKYLNRGSMMQRVNFMQQTALKFERGQISKEEFEFVRRDMQAQVVSETDELTRQQQIQRAQAIQKAAAGMQRPLPTTTTTNCHTLGSQLSCTSTSN